MYSSDDEADYLEQHTRPSVTTHTAQNRNVTNCSGNDISNKVNSKETSTKSNCSRKRKSRGRKVYYDNSTGFDNSITKKDNSAQEIDNNTSQQKNVYEQYKNENTKHIHEQLLYADGDNDISEENSYSHEGLNSDNHNRKNVNRTAKTTNTDTFVSHWVDNLPEEYLERCAILTDLVPLLEGESFKNRTKCIVEGYFRVLNYPISNATLPPTFEKHILFRPVLECKGLGKIDRYKLLNAVGNDINHVHFVAPLFINTNEMEVEKYNQSRKEFHEMREENSSTVSPHECLWKYECRQGRGKNGEEAGLNELAEIIKQMINNATRWCSDAGKSTALAFFTIDDRLTEVRNVLVWMEENLNVNFPPYHVFTPSEIMSSEWSYLFKKYEEESSSHTYCQLHRRKNKAGHEFHCCRRTVILLNYFLADIARFVSTYQESRQLEQQLLKPEYNWEEYEEEEEEEEEEEWEEEQLEEQSYWLEHWQEREHKSEEWFDSEEEQQTKKLSEMSEQLEQQSELEKELNSKNCESTVRMYSNRKQKYMYNSKENALAIFSEDDDEEQ